jgi:C1A family cysteine protease
MYEAYKHVILPEDGKVLGTGWLPPLPDLRDYTEQVKDIPEMTEKLGIPPQEDIELLEETDWRAYCSEVEDQGSLGSCTAHAAVGAAEYFQQ